MDPVKEFRWFVTEYHEVAFARGFANTNGDWYFSAPYYIIPACNVYMEEKLAVKAAREGIKKHLAYYKEKLSKLNKRSK